jgi:hypothetical protein
MSTTGTSAEQPTYHQVSGDDASDDSDSPENEQAVNDLDPLRSSMESEATQRPGHPMVNMTISDGPDNSKRNSSWWPSGWKRRTLLSVIAAGLVLGVPSVIYASHHDSPSDPPVPEPSTPIDTSRKLPICFVGLGGNGIRVDPTWLSAGHASGYMKEGPSGSKVTNSWCTDINLDALSNTYGGKGPDQTLNVDVVSEDGVTSVSLHHRGSRPSCAQLKITVSVCSSLCFQTGTT